jgi:DNA polymerase-3 subunit epsilon
VLDDFRRRLARRRLKDERYAFLFDEPPPDEWVSVDCETTGLDPKVAEILSVAAIRIKHDRILTSERLEILFHHTAGIQKESVLIHRLRPVDVAAGVPVDQAIDQVLRFIGSRPLVGYYLEFDVKMLNKYVRPRLGIGLPNRLIDVSGLYYDRKTRVFPQIHVDLTFRAIRDDLDLPRRAEHDAFNDALLTAMMYLRLKAPSD